MVNHFAPRVRPQCPHGAEAAFETVGEPLDHLGLPQKLLDVIHEGVFNLPRSSQVGSAKEVKYVRVLEDLDSHVRVVRRQRGSAVTHRLALVLVEPSCDPQEEVPEPFGELTST